MIDPDLKKQLEEINKNLTNINKNTGSLWPSFLIGTVRGLGAIFGVAIALAIIGFILDAIGIIPAFSSQMHAWKQTLDNLAKFR